jgi:surface polysaccharide O-acyltransferase-like enzyme
MHLPSVNYLAVLVSGIVIFVLGGLWYSPVLFAKPWIALQGKTEEQMRAGARSSSMPLMYGMAFLCGLLIAWALAVVINHFTNPSAVRGAEIGAFCWLGFAGATSFASALFSMKPRALWLIDSGYNLVCFVIAGAILGTWR